MANSGRRGDRMSIELAKPVIVDVSVFADYYFFYPRKPERHERARRVLDGVSMLGIPVYEPFIFEIELRAVLVRKISPEQVLEIVDRVLRHVNIVEERWIHDKAAEVALLTGYRAVDAYYIAASKHLDAVLITSDKVMKQNALKAGVETYYLLDDKDYNVLMNKLMAE